MTSPEESAPVWVPALRNAFAQELAFSGKAPDISNRCYTLCLNYLLLTELEGLVWLSTIAR